MTFAWFVACGWAGGDGELWLRIEQTEADGDHVAVALPVSSLREDGAPVTLTTPSGTVDLRAEARRLHGGERRFTTADGAVVRLTDEPASGPAATLVAIGISGPKGGGLEATVPLEPGALGEVDRDLERSVDVDLDGLSLTLDEAACAQLRRSPPTLLLEIVGPQGNGLRVRTR